MRKFIPILLVSLFAFNLAGYYIAFPLVSTCFKSIVRAGMEANLLRKDLILIKVPTNLTKVAICDFQMTDEDEFQYKGKMYDVSEKKVIGDITYYYCYNDKDEDQLFSGLDDHIKSDSGIYSGNSKHDSHDFVKKPFKVYLKTFVSSSDLLMTGNMSNFDNRKSFYKSLSIEFNSPPPEAIA